MFTGIIESVGTVKEIQSENLNKHFCMESNISKELKPDQSVSHNGVCLTVTKVEGNTHWVTAVDETLKRSNLSSLKKSDLVNLERCMKADGRFDGHIVQGHVDGVAICKNITEQGGSHLFQFEHDGNGLLVEKGSVCINGISLTCFNVMNNTFSVAIIPYTLQHTNFHSLQPGDKVNIEFDIIGKYIAVLLNKR